MPKIRGIKPDFWTDDVVVELSMPARLLFIGLWNYACDNGHVEDRPKQLKMRILPGDDVSIEKLLTELVRHGRIERNAGTITLPNFAFHQKPHKTWWMTCDLPECERPDGAPVPKKRGKKTARNSGDTVAQPLTTVDHGCATSDVDVSGSDVDVTGTADAAASDIDDDFETWWGHYPRKVNKGAARKSYRAARKKSDRDVLLAAIVEQAATWKAAGTEDRFIPHGSSWLNGERWDDEAPAPAKASGQTEWWLK